MDELEKLFLNERFRLSERAKNIMRDSGIYVFSDFYEKCIEGTEVSNFKYIRNCGAKTEKELKGLVRLIMDETKELIPKTEFAHPVQFNSRVELVFEERFNRMSNRSKNVLINAGIETFKEFYKNVIRADSPNTYIFRLRNCGTLTLKEILNFKDEIEKLAINDNFNDLPVGLFADLKYLLFEANYFNEKEQLIMREYFCFEKNQERKTLEAISKHLGITRERVRQISNDTLKKIREKLKRNVYSCNHDINKYFLQDCFETGRSLTEQINLSESTNFSSSFIAYILELVCPVNYTFINTRRNRSHNFSGFFVLSEIAIDFQLCFVDIKQKLNTNREKDVKIGLENLMELYRENKSMTNPPRLNSFNLLEKTIFIKALKLIANAISDDKNNFQINSDYIVFKRNTKRLKHEYLREIMREFNKPMHYTELETECLQRDIKIGSVTGALMRYPEIFGLKGPGTYGLIEWGGCFGSIGDVTEKLLEEKNEPIDRKELEDILCRELYISQDSIREVLFNYSPEHRFVKLKNDKIALRKWKNKA